MFSKIARSVNARPLIQPISRRLSSPSSYESVKKNNIHKTLLGCVAATTTTVIAVEAWTRTKKQHSLRLAERAEASSALWIFEEAVNSRLPRPFGTDLSKLILSSNFSDLHKQMLESLSPSLRQQAAISAEEAAEYDRFEAYCDAAIQEWSTIAVDFHECFDLLIQMSTGNHEILLRQVFAAHEAIEAKISVVTQACRDNQPSCRYFVIPESSPIQASVAEFLPPADILRLSLEDYRTALYHDRDHAFARLREWQVLRERVAYRRCIAVLKNLEQIAQG